MKHWAKIYVGYSQEGVSLVFVLLLSKANLIWTARRGTVAILVTLMDAKCTHKPLIHIPSHSCVLITFLILVKESICVIVMKNQTNQIILKPIARSLANCGWFVEGEVNASMKTMEPEKDTKQSKIAQILAANVTVYSESGIWESSDSLIFLASQFFTPPLPARSIGKFLLIIQYLMQNKLCTDVNTVKPITPQTNSTH